MMTYTRICYMSGNKVSERTLTFDSVPGAPMTRLKALEHVNEWNRTANLHASKVLWVYVFNEGP